MSDRGQDGAGPSSSADKRAVAGIDNTARRQFDLEEFRAKAAKREIEEAELDGLTPHEIKQLKRRSAPLLHCLSFQSSVTWAEPASALPSS